MVTAFRPIRTNRQNPAHHKKAALLGPHGDAIEFLMSKQGLTYPDALRWLAKKYSIVIPDDAHDEWSDRLNAIIEKAKQAEARRLEQMQQVKTLYLPVETPAAMMKQAANSTFVIWIYSLPWNDEQRARLPKMLNNYAIGVSRDGLTVFWQIDEQARVHTGKMMRYKPDGHRDKDSDYNFDWVHSKLFRQRVYNEEEYDYETCLFGQHLLPFCPDAQIHLVESEKTALIMATYYGNMSRNLWRINALVPVGASLRQLLALGYLRAERANQFRAESGKRVLV